MFKMYFFLFSLFATFFLQAADDLAVIVIGYNRPGYLEKVLASLAENPESEKLPIYFFFDGGPESAQEQNYEVARSFSFPNAHYTLRESNWGCPKNIIDARRQIFDVLKYDKALVLEDDQVLSPNYIRFILALYHWCKENMENIGLVSGWNPCVLPLEEKQKHLHEVAFSTQNLWAYIIDKECWDKIKDVYYEYEKLFLQEGGRSHHIRASAIRRWIRKKIMGLNPSYLKRKKPSFFGINLLSNSYPIGQDGICVLGLWLNNLTHVATLVNRSVNIGEMGLNSTPEFFNKYFKGVSLDIFAEDEEISEFTFLKTTL